MPSGLSDSFVVTLTVKPFFSSSSRAPSSDFSMTLGTSTVGAPEETTTVTVPSLSIVASAAGSCVQIWPFSCCSQGSSAPFLTVTPALEASVSASSIVEPTRFGALIWLSLELSARTTRPIRIAPMSTRTAATIRRIVEVLLFFCWRRRPARSS
ncbi:hypothetical protein SCALM49S_02546 [Streptomyces californicus]